jgi:CubicO group peptidase (beta-lactamase class C family)
MFLLMMTVMVTSCSSYPKTTIHEERPVAFATDADDFLNRLVENGAFSGAVLVARGDQVLLSKGYGFADRTSKIPNTPPTKFRMGSITKQFTAMAILILQADGKLNVQDLICNHIPDCPPPWQTITIHHLLTHTSGIPNFTNFVDYGLTKATSSTPEEIIARFKDKPLDFPPGEGWGYSNSGYIVLGYIIERVAGTSYEDFLQQNIFTPLELHDTGYDHNRKDLAIGYRDSSTIKADFVDMSIPYASGALYSTVLDLYRWDKSLDTAKLIPQDLQEQMFTAQASIPDSAEASYGYGWVITQILGHQVFQHRGDIVGYSSYITHFPDDRGTIIVMSNQQNVDSVKIGSVLAEKLFGEK